MGRYVFKLPDVGEGTAEAELVAWHVKVGDVVEEDQVIADVMTDKATVELTSPVAGKVTAAHGEPGQQLAVGSPLVEFEVEGAGNAEAAAPAPVAKPAEAPAPAQSVSPPAGGARRRRRRRGASPRPLRPAAYSSCPTWAKAPPRRSWSRGM